MANVRHLTDSDVGPKVQRCTVALSAGEVTWTFATPFATKPVVGHMFEESADNQPVIVKVKSFTQANGQYTAVTIKGYRAQTLPSVIALLSALVNFNIFGGAAPTVSVHIWAAEATQ